MTKQISFAARALAIGLVTALVLAGTAMGEVSKDGLVAEYHFDGDAKDSSGNNNDGTINGATFVQGISGQALSFNGVNDYVRVPDSPILYFNDFTFTAWVKTKRNGAIIEKDIVGSGTHDYTWYISGDGTSALVIGVGGSNYWIGGSSKSVNDGNWRFVAARRTANTIEVWVDGVLDKSLPAASGRVDGAGEPLTIGAGKDWPEMQFTGAIDEIRIYNRALSPEEIKASYDSIIGKSSATTATKPAPAPTSSLATPAPTIAQTASPAPAPTAASESSNSYVYAGVGGLVLIFIAIVALKRRSSSKVEEPIKREPTVKPEPQKPALVTEAPKSKPAPITVPEAPSVYVKTAFGYKGAAIIYKLKIENNTSDPISDIKVYPYIPDVFLLKEKEKSIALIEPKASQTVTFEIRPTGECGDCNVSGRVNYYDMASRKRQDIELEPKSLSIVCPMLHGKEISETDWHDTVSNLVKTEESTREIDMPAESLFTMVSRIIKDMHMHMQKPEVTQNHKLFNGVARFYGEGVKGLKYAAQVEVVGGAKKSKLILKVWAEKEDALTGFYHGMLDEIEKRVNVKEYIDDSIVQYNVHIGDKIGTLVKDSVVQRSTIGASAARKCPNCGREVEANEKFCLECGAKL
ncbi:MAG: zinc-ribbon domain-containing protein [Candidatus Methanoperedens sp.]|nr:zinc-ribbon domain-containing protein [Candidatus Methanoperedens sp.]